MYALFLFIYFYIKYIPKTQPASCEHKVYVTGKGWLKCSAETECYSI